MKNCETCHSQDFLQYQSEMVGEIKMVRIVCACGNKSNLGVGKAEADEHWNNANSRNKRYRRKWRYNCDICGFQANTIGGLQSHRFARHGLRGERLVERKAATT